MIKVRLEKNILLLLAVLCVMMPVVQSCSDTDDKRIERIMGRMTLKQKVCQMFVVRPEVLAGAGGKAVTGLTDEMAGNFARYPAGGFCLFAQNILTPEQTLRFTDDLHSLKPAPILCIDEEGGRVARIAHNASFGKRQFESMTALASSGGEPAVYEASRYIGEYVRDYGFDVDFAPVADVNTNPDNIVIGARAFSDNPDEAAKMVASYLKGFEDAGIIGCLKHFPGHGDTSEDTHAGFAASYKTWEQMDTCEMVTFKEGIASGVPMIMVAHIAAPNVTGTDTPATMSQILTTDKLRGELGFEGIIITDALEMGAIAKRYSSAEAAVSAVKAGADIVLMPADFQQAVDGVVRAVEEGSIDMERIDASVRRILEMKASKGLL